MSAATASYPARQKNHGLERLFVEHYRRVLMASYRITGNMADAEDVAQAVFLRLGSGGLPAVANAGSYLYRAAINGALDLLRKTKTAAAESLDSASDLVTKEPAASPERAAGNSELARQLRLAIGGLAPRAAEMFALRYLEELSNGEIAKLMGTSQAVVAVTLYQSRLKLKRRLAELQRGMR
ncbi:RNA polymerase sigma factor [Occallatibacter riparius]|uniref:RNA polymerase sigma factor n=1 Tax=Occallatibacter riparius TaxID=1002689 RepID=A0A9J7BWZ2_9BACT|nr:RNA polymerase sigma factor [Occallatibacter riparius]UWZ85406.1 RNA polymerase sigma factor [Occallatibacter riparius]